MTLKTLESTNVLVQLPSAAKQENVPARLNTILQSLIQQHIMHEYERPYVRWMVNLPIVKLRGGLPAV